MEQLLPLLGYSVALLLMMMSIFVAMGLWGDKKTLPPVSFFKISGSVGFDDLKSLSITMAQGSIKKWNRYSFGEPYLVLEKIYKNGIMNEYLAVPTSFESELQGFLLLKGIKLEKSEAPEPIEAESILVSNFSFKSLGSINKLNNIVASAASSQYGGAVIQLLMKGNRQGGITLNSRLMAFGDETEAKRIIYSLGGNLKSDLKSKKLEWATSLRLFRDKNSEEL